MLTQEQVIETCKQANLGACLTHSGQPRIYIEGADWHTEMERALNAAYSAGMAAESGNSFSPVFKITQEESKRMREYVAGSKEHTPLLQWIANLDGTDNLTEFDKGYEAARAWVKMQLTRATEQEKPLHAGKIYPDDGGVAVVYDDGATPQQEPFATLRNYKVTGLGAKYVWTVGLTAYGLRHIDDKYEFELYTSPQPLKPLSDEEIVTMYAEAPTSDAEMTPEELATWLEDFSAGSANQFSLREAAPQLRHLSTKAQAADDYKKALHESYRTIYQLQQQLKGKVS